MDERRRSRKSEAEECRKHAARLQIRLLAGVSDGMAMEIRDAKTLKRMAATLLLLSALQCLNIGYGGAFWLNLTDSEPIGLYRVHRLNREIRRGDLIVMAVPPEYHQYVYARGWLPEGWSLFKHVGGVPGDSYCVTACTLTVNGDTVGPVYETDQEGLALPRLNGCRQVPAGFFLPVATRTPRSFDGRYMGPVSVSEIRGVVKPVVTFQ